MRKSYVTLLGMERIPRALIFALALIMAGYVGGAQGQSQEAADGRDWLISLFGGVATNDSIEDVFLGDVTLDNSYFVSVAVGRRVWNWNDRFALETEAQFAQHFKRDPLQEYTIALLARWNDFPWNDYIKTSVAFGDGLSYVSQIPAIEIERQGQDVNHLLNYIVIEATAAPPSMPYLELVLRLHHRSGVFGLFDGADGGSNFIATGLRFRF